MIFYHETGENVLKELGSDASYGLTDEQVLQRKQQYGENRLREKKKKTNLQRFLDQFKDVMILILIGAALISFVVACVEGNPKEFFEPASSAARQPPRKRQATQRPRQTQRFPVSIGFFLRFNLGFEHFEILENLKASCLPHMRQQG